MPNRGHLRSFLFFLKSTLKAYKSRDNECFAGGTYFRFPGWNPGQHVVSMTTTHKQKTITSFI